ncbi:MAG: cobalt-precorrin-5B (C(1))-methyltransferase CbiD [Deltaproteobacteria bacterium]|jgi:cobalt-precorrin-5B (C1)-methyltransferase|nr:cobalt-precorrin-5B (C(1))-methyltransferase CbiD [Deltaproteobacteria bacterium]
MVIADFNKPLALPELDLVKKKAPLRLGFSTGSAATAAALGAAIFIRHGRPPDKVTISLPKGESLDINISEASRDHLGLITCSVIKDAGDDPDVTNGAKISVSLEPIDQPHIYLIGGSGVGRVTKPGLAAPVGGFAINPVPTRMLIEHLSLFISAIGPGLKATVSILDGERLALKTLNPRLGVIGGLSILGTTGLVRPFSHQAYAQTIETALKVALAQGLEEIVLTTGGRSETMAREARPDLPLEGFIQIADFFSFGLKSAAALGFKTIGLASFFGKAVKQASGAAYTHARSSDLDLGALAASLKNLSSRLSYLISSASTALNALEILKAENQLWVVQELAQSVVKAAARFAGAKVNIWTQIFDFDGLTLARAELKGRDL